MTATVTAGVCVGVVWPGSESLGFSLSSAFGSVLTSVNASILGSVFCSAGVDVVVVGVAGAGGEAPGPPGPPGAAVMGSGIVSFGLSVGAGVSLGLSGSAFFTSSAGNQTASTAATKQQATKARDRGQQTTQQKQTKTQQGHTFRFFRHRFDLRARRRGVQQEMHHRL